MLSSAVLTLRRRRSRAWSVSLSRRRAAAAGRAARAGPPRVAAGRCSTYRWKCHRGAFALGRLWQRHDPYDARVGVFGDPLDGAAPRRRRRAFEDHGQPGTPPPAPTPAYSPTRSAAQEFTLVYRSRDLHRFLAAQDASLA